MCCECYPASSLLYIFFFLKEKKRSPSCIVTFCQNIFPGQIPSLLELDKTSEAAVIESVVLSMAGHSHCLLNPTPADHSCQTIFTAYIKINNFHLELISFRNTDALNCLTSFSSASASAFPSTRNSTCSDNLWSYFSHSQFVAIKDCDHEDWSWLITRTLSHYPREPHNPRKDNMNLTWPFVKTVAPS